MKKIYSLLTFAFVALTAMAQSVPGPFISPEGESALYKVDREGFAVVWGELAPTNSPTASNVVFGQDNEVYFKIVPAADHNGFVKGVREGNKIIVELPQAVGEIVDEWSGETCPVYADVVEFNNDESDPWYFNSGEKSTIEYTMADDGSFSINLKEKGEGYFPSKMIGLLADLDPDAGMWIGFGDWSETYTPHNEKPLALPEGITTEEWVLAYDNEARNVQVAIDGNDIYLGNLSNELPDSYVKGTIDGDKVTFPLTYMGYSQTLDNFVYFVPCYWEEFYFEPWGEDVEDYIIHDTFTFDFDAESKCLSNIEDMAAIMLGTSNKVGEMADSYIEYFFEPEIRWLDPAHADDPLDDPEFLEAYHDDWYECDIIAFYLPSINQGGYPLDTNRMSYVFYVDGEPFTFTTDVYIGLEEDMTAIPFDFCDWDNQDIWAYGQEHQVCLYLEPESYSTVGVKIYYEKKDGTVIESNYVEANIEHLSQGGITSAIKRQKPQSAGAEKYYDLNGRQIAQPSGICIKVGADGVRKMLK